MQEVSLILHITGENSLIYFSRMNISVGVMNETERNRRSFINMYIIVHNILNLEQYKLLILVKLIKITWEQKNLDFSTFFKYKKLVTKYTKLQIRC